MDILSSVLAKTITAPWEVSKIVLQTQSTHRAIRSGEIGRVSGTIDCFSRIVNRHGITALWRGNLVRIIRTPIIKRLSMLVDPPVRRYINENTLLNQKLVYSIVNALSGTISGMLVSLIVYPFDYVETRLASDAIGFEGRGGRRRFDGTIDCLRKTIGSHPRGFLGLYCGFSINVLGIFINRLGFYCGRDLLQLIAPPKTTRGSVSRFMIYFGSVTVATFVSYPIETIRRRLMMQGDSYDHRLYSGAWDCCCSIVREEGLFFGLWAGFIDNMIQTLITSLFFQLWDEGIKYLYPKQQWY